jgi:dTDP-4-dehydrorhamnose 3,5-epimerase-like enzyme
MRLFDGAVRRLRSPLGQPRSTGEVRGVVAPIDTRRGDTPYERVVRTEGKLDGETGQVSAPMSHPGAVRSLHVEPPTIQEET